MPDVWSHDKFADNTRGPQNTVRGMGKLLISNLDFGVNDSDINVSVVMIHGLALVFFCFALYYEDMPYLLEVCFTVA